MPGFEPELGLELGNEPGLEQHFSEDFFNLSVSNKINR